MGRLLKKKNSIRKKQKKQDADGVSPSPSGKESTVRKASSASADLQKKTTATGRSSAVSRQPNFVRKSVQFLREVKAELKKVTWPSRKQTVGSTAVVIILVMIVSSYLGIVDMGLSLVVRWLLQ